MKIFALGLLGLGWFAHSLHSSERSDSTMDWLKQQATSLQSQAASRTPDAGSASEKAKPADALQHTLALASEALPRPPESDGKTDLSVKEALEWVLEKSHENLSNARAGNK